MCIYVMNIEINAGHAWRLVVVAVLIHYLVKHVARWGVINARDLKNAKIVVLEIIASDAEALLIVQSVKSVGV